MYITIVLKRNFHPSPLSIQTCFKINSIDNMWLQAGFLDFQTVVTSYTNVLTDYNNEKLSIYEKHSIYHRLTKPYNWLQSQII